MKSRLSKYEDLQVVQVVRFNHFLQGGDNSEVTMTAYIMATMIQAGIALEVSLPVIMIFFQE